MFFSLDMYIYICVCLPWKINIYIYVYIKKDTYIYMYIYIYLCIKREREREREFSHPSKPRFEGPVCAATRMVQLRMPRVPLRKNPLGGADSPMPCSGREE